MPYFEFMCLMLLRVRWSATYTYILLLFIAAAFVAFVARPRTRGEAVKTLHAGTLLPVDSNYRPGNPRIQIKCLGQGHVLFRRLDVEGLTSSGAVSLAVTTKGKDVEIVERVSYGYHSDPEMAGAEFDLDLTGFEWRHVRWMNEDSGLWCAFTLHVREGIEFEVELRH